MDDRFGLSLLTRAFGAVEIWLAVAYLVGMFVAATFRPGNIAQAAVFRASYIVFACYLTIPAVIIAIVQLATMERRGPGPGQTAITIWQLSEVAGRILLAISIVLGLASLRRPSVPSYPSDADAL